jgi:hypothetical protein
MKTKLLSQALYKNASFIGKAYFFNTYPENQKEPFDGRFWIIEIFNLDMKKIGVMIWDDVNEKLHGPYVHPEEKILEGYKFAGPAITLIKLYLYFEGQSDYCISEFDAEKPTFEEC